MKSFPIGSIPQNWARLLGYDTFLVSMLTNALDRSNNGFDLHKTIVRFIYIIYYEQCLFLMFEDFYENVYHETREMLLILN